MIPETLGDSWVPEYWCPGIEIRSLVGRGRGVVAKEAVAAGTVPLLSAVRSLPILFAVIYTFSLKCVLLLLLECRKADKLGRTNVFVYVQSTDIPAILYRGLQLAYSRAHRLLLVASCSQR